ncbi:putative MFS-type transporter, partial [Frankliniella fusca]
NEDSLTAKLEEVENDIAKEREQRSKAAPLKRSRGSRKPASKPGSASERVVASVLGNRPPVPDHLKATKAASLLLKKRNAKSYASGQNSLDGEVTSSVKKQLFESSVNAVDTSNSDSADMEADTVDFTDDDSDHNVTSATVCKCPVSQFVHKHCSPTTSAFLRDLTYLFENHGDLQEKIYLTLLPIPDTVKKVELSSNRGVFIAQSDKEEIRVDFKNKSSALCREALFCLYGKEVFQTHNVTARGLKRGSYGIEEKVLKSVLELVNHNVELSNRMKFSTMVASINKRAPEWRAKGALRASEKKKKTPKSKQQVFSSPFKCSPLPLSDADKEDVGNGKENVPALAKSGLTSTPLQNITCPPHTEGLCSFLCITT